MKHKGFTLIEVILVVAIFAILLIPISNVLRQTVSLSSKSKQYYELSQAITKAYEDVSHFLKDQNPNFLGNGFIFYNDENGNIVYKITYSVSLFDSYSVSQVVYSSSDIKKIDFNVEDASGRNVKNVTYYLRVIK